MARIRGKTIGLRIKALKVYISEEQWIYLRRLYYIRKKRETIWIKGKTNSYSISRFLSYIIGLYIQDHWETLESIDKEIRELRKQVKGEK